jgi:hypothetical protein
MDGSKELIYLDLESGETFMRPATAEDVEDVAIINAPPSAFAKRFFGDLI